MSVYNRKMFRGSRPTAQDAQQAVDVGITSVMADMTRGVKAAENFEQAINAFRGDQKPMKERRQELAGIVGMKDAKKTPESVVTLVQPVMEMRQASEKVSHINAIADNEQIFHRKPHIVGFDRDFAFFVLVQQYAGVHRFGTAGGHQIGRESQRAATVQNIVDDQHAAPSDVFRNIPR